MYALNWIVEDLRVDSAETRVRDDIFPVKEKTKVS